MAGMHARRRLSRGVDEVSVITVCRNAERTIARTVESVLSQTVPPMEYIIIDGASTDGTLDLLRSYGKKITTIVSEPDSGSSDAFNKGLHLAKGGAVKLLNADDWLENDTIEKSVSVLEQFPEAGFVFGDLIEHDEGQDAGRRVPGDPGYSRWLPRVMGPLNHPSVTVRREIYERYGGFDLRWKLAMDYDWFLRVHRQGITGRYDPSIIVHMGAGGRATARRRNAFKEVRSISIEHGYSPSAAYGYYAARVGKDAVLRLLGRR